MKHKSILTHILAATALAAMSFCAVAAADADTDGLLSKLKKTYPNIPFSQVNKTEVPGVYEAIFGTDLLYTEKTGTYFFPTVFDMKKQRNIGDERRADLSVVDFSSIPINEAIKTVVGDGSRQVVIFADANCGFCKKLDVEIAKLNNLTIYTFPVGILGANSVEKAKRALCFDGDKSKAWADLMRGIEPTNSVVCDTQQHERNLELFKKLGFQGTPAVVFKNGRVLKGYAEAARIEADMAK